MSDLTKYIFDPVMRGATRLVAKENAWKSGSTTRNESRSSMGAPNIWRAPSMSETKLACVSIAPLGRPVVPEV